MTLRFGIILSTLILMALHSAFGQQNIKNQSFDLQTSQYGLGGIRKTDDHFNTNYVAQGRVFGELSIIYAHNKKVFQQSSTASNTTYYLHGERIASYQPDSTITQPLALTQTFRLEDNHVLWEFELTNQSDQIIRVEDLAIPVHYAAPAGESPEIIFEQSTIKHQYISGDNSYLFFERPTGLGPYLLMTPEAGTSLEYYSDKPHLSADDHSFKVFIHAAYTANKNLKGDWRQPVSQLTLAPNASQTYAFKLQWAADYDHIRDLLVAEGKIDVQVMPGMTIPTDLDVQLALRTLHPIDSIVPEYRGKQTSIDWNKTQSDAHYYTVRFRQLGENKLTIYYGGKYQTQLEFFVTEPLTTLYQKRAAFIAKRQQVRDSSKWFDGLFGIYDMKNAVLRTPDNPDYFDTTRLKYVLTCDDPALCKAPFLAAKNAIYPDPKEIAAVEYYIENFVWGKLQRTDQETPNPYGIYGTPDWPTNRDTKTREANTADPYRFKMHIWRSYDYPHIMMMYYHMFQIAERYPHLVKYADRTEYLKRMKETAKAYFIYPYEILPWYETYKWGCYNEMLIPEIITLLKEEGFDEDAEFLTKEWEKKVKYFVYDDKYPFRSEYAVDATAFESSYALAKYGATHTMQPDSNLWFDKNDSVWYSHPVVDRADAADFMDRQLAANLALRGVIEPTYYWLGSDFRGRNDFFNLSYMSQMGGWAILDQALHFSEKPEDYLRIGYQSYLSSFALINSGTPETNYGYWYGGQENDGATGWAYEPQQSATSWIQKPQGRGPWYYDGEIDLGFGGALRTAATIIADDPIFGRIAYGGNLQQEDQTYSVVPRDGIRQKCYIRTADAHLDLALVQDGFAANEPIVWYAANNSFEFTLENRAGIAHKTTLQLSGLSGNYQIIANGKSQGNVINPTELIIPLKAEGTTPIRLKHLK